MTDYPDIIVIARSVADAFERAGMVYAIGGAIACGYWSVPRSTIDVDVNVFVPVDDIDPVLEVLEGAGLLVDRDRARKRARDEGYFTSSSKGVRVDVFVPSIPFYDSVRERLVTVPLAGRPAAILSAEDLTVFKLLFFRGKDIEDVKRIVATQGDDFDVEYARAALVEIMGDDDARVQRLDDIVETFLPPNEAT